MSSDQYSVLGKAPSSDDLKKLSSSFGTSSQFSKAVNLISKTRGKVLVVVVGKSYIIGIKVSSFGIF